jgi:hypothetical protein
MVGYMPATNDIDLRGIDLITQRHNARRSDPFLRPLPLIQLQTGISGNLITVIQAAKIPGYVVRRRLRRGWSATEALNSTTPWY